MESLVRTLSSEDIKHYEGLKAAGYLTKSTEFQLLRFSKCFTKINKFKSNFVRREKIILPISHNQDLGSRVSVRVNLYCFAQKFVPRFVAL